MQRELLVSDVKDQKAKSIWRAEKMLNIFLLTGTTCISGSSDRSFIKWLCAAEQPAPHGRTWNEPPV